VSAQDLDDYRQAAERRDPEGVRRADNDARAGGSNDAGTSGGRQ
jgi:hypothetical protein